MTIDNDLVEYLKDHHNTEEKAIKSRDLSVLFNLKSRDIRNIVTVLRQEGKPVCSSSNGYWYSEDPEDLEKTLHRMEAQVHNMSLSIAGLQKKLMEVQDE